MQVYIVNIDVKKMSKLVATLYPVHHSYPIIRLNLSHEYAIYDYPSLKLNFRHEESFIEFVNSVKQAYEEYRVVKGRKRN